MSKFHILATQNYRVDSLITPGSSPFTEKRLGDHYNIRKMKYVWGLYVLGTFFNCSNLN